MKKLTGCALAAAGTSLALLSHPSFAADTNSTTKSPRAESRLAELFGDPVVAKGKGFEVKQSELDAEVARTKTALASRGGTIPAGIEPQILDGMISLRLLLNKATPEDRAKAKEQFTKSFNDYKKATHMTDEQFNDRLAPELKMENRTHDEWENQQIDQAAIPIVVQRELKITITPDEAKKFYDDNPADFESPEMVHVSHVLLSTKDPDDKAQDPSQRKDLPEDQKKAKFKKMEDLLKRARAGEDFSKLAKEFSEDPGVKQNSGEYTFSREDPFVPEFKSAAFALKTNQVSDIVTTMFGYHIIKLLDKIPAKKESYSGIDTKTIHKKPDGSVFTIKDVLTERDMRKELPAYVRNLRKEADVQVLDDKLKMTPQTDAAAASAAISGAPAAPAPAPAK
jgi:parvulin-like peptidyl-prolyl isomerase